MDQYGGYSNHQRSSDGYRQQGASLNFTQPDTDPHRSEGFLQRNVNRQGIYVKPPPSGGYYQYDGYNAQNQFTGYASSNAFFNYNQNVNPNAEHFHEQVDVYMQPLPDTFADYPSEFQEDNSDEAFIRKFVSNINKPPPVVKQKQAETKHVKNVTATKSQLRRCFEIVEKLESTRKELHEQIETLSSEAWDAKTSEIDALSSELTSLIQFENVELLKRSMERRRRKRAQRRERMNLEKAEVLRENSRKHKEIDRWLENMRDNVERAKAEENMKKDADCVLAEVTKKKSDGKKQIVLIEALIKLREVREKAAVNRGEKLNAEDSAAFGKTCGKLRSIWEKSMQVYGKEEQGLRIMLEQGGEVERKTRKTTGKEAVILKKWEGVLFGDDLHSGSALYWGLTQADRDFETFVAIRKSWDTFLCTERDENASGIPIGWVLPNNNPNDDWKQYLKP